MLHHLFSHTAQVNNHSGAYQNLYDQEGLFPAFLFDFAWTLVQYDAVNFDVSHGSIVA
jgi:hypothetical protein